MGSLDWISHASLSQTSPRLYAPPKGFKLSRLRRLPKIRQWQWSFELLPPSTFFFFFFPSSPLLFVSFHFSFPSSFLFFFSYCYYLIFILSPPPTIVTMKMTNMWGAPFPTFFLFQVEAAVASLTMTMTKGQRTPPFL